MKIRLPVSDFIHSKHRSTGAAVIAVALACAIAACNKESPDKNAGAAKDEAKLKSTLRPKDKAPSSAGSAAFVEPPAKPVDLEKEKLRKALEEAGPSALSDQLSKMTVEELRALLSDPNLKNDRRLNGIAALVFAVKAGPSGSKSDLALITGAPCELRQMGIAAEEFFKQAQAAGKRINASDFSDSFGSGAKRDQLIRAYYTAVPKPLEQIVTEAEGLGQPEDARNALEGAAASKEWAISELAPLLGTKNEDLIPSFTRSLMMEMFTGQGNATVPMAEWNALNALPDESAKLDLKAYLVSELGRQDPQIALTLLSKESPEDRQVLIQDSKFTGVIRSYSDRDPVECIEFIASSELPAAEEGRLVGVALSQWLAMDSTAASNWVGEQSGKPYYNHAAAKMAKWLRGKGDEKSALKWESSISK